MTRPAIARASRAGVSGARCSVYHWFFVPPLALSFACSSSQGRIPDDERPPKQTGSLELNLIAPDEVEVSSVRYQVVDAGGQVVFERSVDYVAGDSFEFFMRLPAASGYELELYADGSFEGETVPCEGRARFNIEPREVTQVELDVLCTSRGRALRPAGNGNGGAQVTAHVSVDEDATCAVKSLTVGPLVVYEGRDISLRAVVFPEDAVLEWSTSEELRGDFEIDETTAGGEFTCQRGQGEIVLSLKSGECSDSASVPVTCAAPSVCGDGAVDIAEACDDGNNIDEDGCNATCSLERCGDGVLQRGESCDDGNEVAGDGCGATCSVEVCGNGLLEGAERCDDGNLTLGDGCSDTCEIEACADGVVQAALGEECDDGNQRPNDGCSETCRFEDLDGDGVIDQLDECEATEETWIDLEGCSLEQRCPCAGPWDSKSQYLSCSSTVLDRLFAADVIDAEERAEIAVELAENDCGT